MELVKVIVRRSLCKNEEKYENNKHEHEYDGDLPFEEEADKVMSDAHYREYIEKHGYHFTDALAEHASKMMQNANGQSHSWNTVQVKKALEALNLDIPNTVTDGDVTYLANMYYADLYPDPLKEEIACIKAAYRVANDPDGYEGLTFFRWIADVIGKNVNIDWKKFV